MDPILRTALDWYLEETRAREPLADVYRALWELRVKIDKLPSRLFYLDSPDEPYGLPQILMVMGKHALAWQADPDVSVERRLLAPQVEEILREAMGIRELLAVASKKARAHLLPQLPASEVRRSMEERGEPLPDRLPP